MDKLFLISGIIILGSVYLNFDSIKNNYLKYKTTEESKKIVVDFFILELKKNKNLSLEEAILKFEDTKLKYKNLNELSLKTGRNIKCYTNAYKDLFEKAKKLNY